jgi:S-adenosylmethionine synthetase
LRLCDGAHTFGDIVLALGAEFAGSDVALVEAETAAFLDRLIARHVVVLE